MVDKNKYTTIALQFLKEKKHVFLCLLQAYYDVKFCVHYDIKQDLCFM